MDVERRLLDIVGAIYQAAVEPELWTESLAALCRTLDAKTGALWLCTARSGPSEHAYNKDPEAVRTFFAHYINTLPETYWTQPLGTVFDPATILPDRGWYRQEVWNDWSRPFAFETGLHALVASEAGSEARVSLFRDIKSRPFDDDARELLQLMVPHCHRAFTVHRCFEALRAERDTLAGAVERFRLGLVFVDGEGRVVTANRAAREMAASADGLFIMNGRLRGADTERTRALETLIRTAAATGSGGGLGAGGTLLLDRPSMQRPYQIVVSPMRSHVPAGLGIPSCAAMVVIADPERAHEGAVERFARQYRLSGRERDVAARLLAGTSRPDIAAELGVSVETIRTLVRRIYAKTDCSSRSDLIRLLLTGPAALTRTELS